MIQSEKLNLWGLKMSTIDKVKATISVLEKVLIIFILWLFGMSLFLAISIYKLTILQIISTILGIFISIVIIYFLIIILLKKFKELGDLK